MTALPSIKLLTLEEWNRIGMDYKGRWEPNPWNISRVQAGELHPYYIGRRNMVTYEPGKGTVLLTEGINFLILDDYDNLPILEKSNLRIGAYYKALNCVERLLDHYEISKDLADRNHLFYLERVKTTRGDRALSGASVKVNADLRIG